MLAFYGLLVSRIETTPFLRMIFRRWGTHVSDLFCFIYTFNRFCDD
jgi:hypothetical protein